METRNIGNIIINDELYPRDRIEQDKVIEYSQCISLLPPIEINQDNILIDGAHRYWAHKRANQEKINVVVTKTIDDDDLFLKAIEANSQHGIALDNRTKKKLVVRLYSKLLSGEVKYDVDRLKKSFSIPDSTFSDWTKQLNEELESQRLEKILDLHLQCKTQQQIADEVGFETHKPVGTKLTEIQRIIDGMFQNPNSEFGTKYQFLREKVNKLLEFKPMLYNIWNISSISNDYKYYGNIPVEFLHNLLYYYTEPFDIVYDPFAGGGITIDACKKWLRKYYVSDRKPIELRSNEIKNWDIKDGLPKDLPSPKLVFLDPPYWKQAENQYSSDKEDLANMSIEDFYSSIGMLIKNLKQKMKSGSYIALIIQSTQWKNNLKLEDHQYEIQRMFRELGFEFEQRIICPYSTEQYIAQQVEKAKENKICLQIYRDLLIFRKR